MQKKHFTIAILILSIIGLITSSYLTYNHYYHSLDGSVCDITASVSCTVLNSGIYSTIFGIPVAIYGVLWSLVLGMLSWKGMKEKNFIPKILWWNIVGMLFVNYFIYLEYVLDTICPFCTLVHFLVA